MGSLVFDHEIRDDGICFYLQKKHLLKGKKLVSPDAWAEQVDAPRIAAVARVLALVAQNMDDEPPPARQETDGVFLSHDLVAALEEPIARGLDLPPSTLLILGVDCKGGMAQPGFEIRAQWLTGGTIPAAGVSVKGSLLFRGSDSWRIPEPLYTIWSRIQTFQATDTSDDHTRFRLLSDIIEHLPHEERDRINAANYLTRIRIAHATAFSLRLKTSPQGFQFDPVLFSRKEQDRWNTSGDKEPVSEAESLLPEAKQEVFAGQRFPMWGECRDRYAIGDGYYVYLEPHLQKALTVVRRAQGADAETRRSFARNPQAYLKEALSDELDESIVETLFIPTEQYSERVRDLGIWQPVVLPWLKREPTTWLPERFGILVGDIRLDLDSGEARDLKELLKQAIENGEAGVQFRGTSIPATEASISALDKLIQEVTPKTPQPAVEPRPPDTEQDPAAPTFLVVDENYEDLGFIRQSKPRAPFMPGLPAVLKSHLKPHQESGFEWMQKAWCEGLPGVLLADDMGLGKTLAALTFLCWVRDTRLSKNMERRPFLIVAPTGLLKNWEAEHDMHLHPPGLGEILRVYGRELKQVRVSGSAGRRDTDLGQPQLQRERLRQADWIVTTYETLRDYHLSFAAVPMAVVVYDEMQKVKNPASQLSRAVKALNADFALGLTGTPIENRLEDLWAIMDVIHPGYLGDLKGFSRSFKENDLETLRRLKERLMEGPESQPPIMLRRMKHEHLPGLPEKRVEAVREPMPPKQAEAYSEVINGAMGSQGRSMLSTLHKLRSISLHPMHPQEWYESKDDYIALSARLSRTLSVLDTIAARREKVLIFLESLEMQEVLAVMLKRRYRLPRLPMIINGAVAGPKRQQCVNDFQSGRSGFDVLILSPKAGGVGLTLTAANHVIHLSRWWNPAVEDQCTDRIYRIGQDKDVHVYYPMAVHPDPAITECSFDLKLHELLESKRAISRDVLIPPESLDDVSRLYKGVLGEALEGPDGITYYQRSQGA